MARFLPCSVTLLFVVYLGILKPIRDFILTKTAGTDVNNENLWTVQTKALSSEDCRSIFCGMFKMASGGIDLKFNEFRHLMQAYGEKLLSSFDPCQSDLKAVNAQIGHTILTGTTHYAKSQLDVDSIKRTSLANFESLSQQWHVILKMRNSQKSNSNSEKSLDITQPQEAAPVIHQTCFIYPEKSINVVGQSISQQNNNVLGDGESLKKLLKCMRERFDCLAFRSCYQSEAMMAVYSRKQDTLVIMPTGSGKTNVCLVPIAIESKLKLKSVIIVPLVCLKSQFSNRCWQTGISACLWQPHLDIHNLPDVLIVSVETAIMEEFQIFCKRLHKIGLLSRIIIDECHTTSTWSNYRESFLQLRQLRTVPVPLVLLSATVPTEMEEKLKLFYGSCFYTVRQPTVRWNLNYSVEILDNEDELNQRLLELIRMQKGSIVVFVISISEAEKTKDFIQNNGHTALTYTSRLDIAERKNALDLFETKAIGIIVATSAFSIGIDLPMISCVIHKQKSWSMIDYVQECGRAGRSENMNGKCITITTLDHIACVSDVVYATFLKNKTVCRRALIQESMDNKRIFCLQGNGENLCDICLRGNDSMLLEPKQQVIPFEDDPGLLLRSDWNEQIQIEEEENDTPYRSPIFSPVKSGPVSLKPSQLEKMVIATQAAQSQIISVQSSTSNLMHVAKSVQMESTIEKEKCVVTAFLDTVQIIKAKGCVFCLWNRVKCHSLDILACPNFKKSKLCVKCLTNHGNTSCGYKSFSGLCFKCGLPGKANGVKIHPSTGGFGRDCALNASDVSTTLSWLAWRNKQSDLYAEFADLPSARNEMAFFKWMIAKDYYGLPNMARVVMLCVTNKWIKLN